MPFRKPRQPVPAGFGATVVLCAVVVACQGPAPDPLDEIHDLAGVPLPAELAPAVAGARVQLASPEPANDHVERLAAYEALVPRIDRPESRDAASREILERLDREPTQYLWLTLAGRNRDLLSGHLDFADLVARQVYGDSTVGPGAYVRGEYNYNRGGRGAEFLAMDLEAEDPASLNRYFLAIKQASTMARRGEGDAAVRLLLDHLPGARRVGGARLEARLWKAIASFLRRTDRLDGALHAQTVRVAVSRKVGSSYEELNGRIGLASILQQRRETAGAFAMVDACIDSARALNHPWLLSKFLNRAASYHADAGDLERALACDLECLEIAKAVDDSFNVPVTIANVAYDLRLLGRLEESRAYLDEGRRWVAAYPDPRLLAGYPMREVPYYLHVGDYATADSLMQVVMGRLPAASMAAEEAEFHLEQIDFARDLGRADLAYRAIARLEELRFALFDKMGDSNRQAEFAMATADLLAQQGEFRRAAAAVADAAAAVERGGGEGMEWKLARTQGELALRRDDPEGAREAFTHCFELALAGSEPAKLAESRFLLGTALIEAGRPEEAVRFLDPGPEDTAFGGRFRVRLSRRLFAAVARIRAGEIRAGIAGLEAVADECNRFTPPDLRVRLHLELGRALVRVGELDRAEAELGNVVRLLREADARTFSADLRLANRRLRRDVCETLIGFLLDHPRRVRGTDAATATLALLELADTGSGPARRDLEPGLWFFVGRERSFRWLRHPRGLAVSELPGEEALARLVAPVVADVGRPGRPVDEAALGRLADLLLGALATHWEAGRTLHLAPDGVLHAVPWAALPLALPDGGTEPALTRGPLREVAEPDAAGIPRRAGGRLLVLGDDRALDAAGAGVELHHAVAEARAIAAMWRRGEVTLRLGEENDDLTARDFEDRDVIHIASHARFSEGLANRATVRFAAGVPLTATGVARRRLAADLIYLSCCEADRPLAAGGVGSFARACLAAGARTVVASGQRIDDEAAGELARLFYESWLAGRGKAASLRAAQLAIRAARPDWNHPYYWATYRLIGDPE